MSCELTSGRIRGCKDAIGGVKAIFVCPHEELGELTFTNDANGGGVSPQYISNIGETTLYKIDLPKHTASFTQEITSSVENGTVFWTQTVAIQLHKLDRATRAELYLHAINRLAIFVLDNNDNLFLVGRLDGAEVTEGSWETGTVKGDVNGYNMTYTAEERYPADYVIATDGVNEADYPFDNITTPANVTVVVGIPT
jgi:hypothetical protein